MKRLTYWQLTLADVKGFRDLVVIANSQGLDLDYEITIKSPRHDFGFVAFWEDAIGEQHRIEILSFANVNKQYIHSIKEGCRWIDTHNGFDHPPFVPECIMDAIDLAIERYSKNYGE